MQGHDVRGPQRVAPLSELAPRVERVEHATRTHDFSRGALCEAQQVLVEVVLVLADFSQI